MAHGSMVLSGLDRLLEQSSELNGRKYGLLCHQASVTRDYVPAHLALADAAVPPTVLLGPEHGFYGVEQDMVAATETRDPWTDRPVVSLYGDNAGSLAPRPEVFDGLDLLLIDLQDVGARYYTYVATAVWAAAIALDQDCDVWVLDRPNPLGGEVVEGNLPAPGFESFVSAFRVPVRHGLTVAEFLKLEGQRRGWPEAGVRVFEMQGWTRSMHWPDCGRPWIAPSPNMPSYATSVIYPGGCLIEATQLSEGRGTTRPFHLVGAPGLDPKALAADLTASELAGLEFLPTYFRPQFQKHGGEVCAGVEVLVSEPRSVAGFRFGIELLRVFHQHGFEWRDEPYEFIKEIPAIDLLTGGGEFRKCLAGSSKGPDDLDCWIESWSEDEAEFRRECQSVLLYE